MTKKKTIKQKEHIIEIVCDAGEGSQKAGTSFARLCSLEGMGLWTVEIIPAEIQPPPHTTGSASGIRIRISEDTIVTNAGDLCDVVFAFNEMSLLSRIEAGSLKDDATIFIDNIWANHEVPEHRESYKKVLESVKKKGATVIEIPLEQETCKIVENPFKGKNMFALGFLTNLYNLDLGPAKKVIRNIFAKKSTQIIDDNIHLLESGYRYADQHLDFQYEITSVKDDTPKVSMNGNEAIAFGSIAAGFEICSMYPITPATSASHALSAVFEDFGGIVHQAEDEIAAIGVAIGASYAGKPALTITSGPGMALKTEFQGLAVMTEIPMVIVDVQRGGPSTGLPTKIEQADLLHALFGAPGDAPKIVIAPSTIEECYHVMITARKIAEEFRTLVIVLSDANLATGVQLFNRPEVSNSSLPPPMNTSPVPRGTQPFEWDEKTGLSRRLIPGQPGGTCVTTSLNHSTDGKVVYDSKSNQKGHQMRSRKLATFQQTLKKPTVFGNASGDLLIVGWGSTRGVIEEAVKMTRKEGFSVSALNIQFLNPLPPGLKEIFSRFKKVMTVELNYSDDWSDDLINAENRRYSQLAIWLRSHTLHDVDCYSRVLGRPFMPREIYRVLKKELGVLHDSNPDKQLIDIENTDTRNVH